MEPEDVIEQLGKVITNISKDVSKKPVSADKISALSKLVNAYNRLLREQKARTEPWDYEKYGDPNFVRTLRES